MPTVDERLAALEARVDAMSDVRTLIAELVRQLGFEGAVTTARGAAPSHWVAAAPTPHHGATGTGSSLTARIMAGRGAAAPHWLPRGPCS